MYNKKKKNRENAGIQSGFHSQKLRAFCRYTYLLFFQDGGNFKNCSKSQENAVYVLVEHFTIK